MKVCIVFGILGRQGSMHILNKMENILKEKKITFITIMVSELTVDQLDLL